MFAKQALYLLSHTSNPFFSGYFGDRVSLSNCLPELASNCDPPDRSFLSSLDMGVSHGAQLAKPLADASST
jgi:hypothetical protein